VKAVVAALAALAVAAAPAAAQTPTTEVAQSGSVRAEFSYVESDAGPPTGLTLRIFDNGVLRLEDRFPDDQYLQPGGFETRPSVAVADLGGDAAPEVLLDLYTGGAHCCLRTRIYHGTLHHDQEWGDVGYELDDVDGDGSSELRGADGGFAGVFGAYAYSRFPLKVLRWDGATLRDVTGSAAVEPLLRRELVAFKNAYRSARGRLRRNKRNVAARDTVRSALAAYAADQCSLGRCSRGFALVDLAARRKEIRDWGPGGKKPAQAARNYKRDLRRLLRSRGYLE
jgi:hypothetical protein